jgi:hypothetical protein
MGLFFLMAGGCSKSSNVSQDPALNSPSPIPDGLSFPVTKNSYWEYQRIDSFSIPYIQANNTLSNYIIADTSKELLTLIGDTLITTIDPIDHPRKLLVIEIRNLTKNTLDTAYINYTTLNFAIYMHRVVEVDNYFFSPIPPINPTLIIYYPIFTKLQTISLPITNAYKDARLQSLNSYNTSFSTKDTSIIVNNQTYNNCAYLEHIQVARSFAASGAGGFSQRYYSYNKPGIGIVFDYFTPEISQGSAFDKYLGRKWTVRRLINYNIK